MVTIEYSHSMQRLIQFRAIAYKMSIYVRKSSNLSYSDVFFFKPHFNWSIDKNSLKMQCSYADSPNRNLFIYKFCQKCHFTSDNVFISGRVECLECNVFGTTRFIIEFTVAYKNRCGYDEEAKCKHRRCTDHCTLRIKCRKPSTSYRMRTKKNNTMNFFPIHFLVDAAVHAVQMC